MYVSNSRARSLRGDLVADMPGQSGLLWHSICSYLVLFCAEIHWGVALAPAARFAWLRALCWGGADVSCTEFLNVRLEFASTVTAG